MKAQEIWAALLEADEYIIWQGRPDSNLRLEWKGPVDALFAVVFVMFPIFWMYGAMTTGEAFWMFGLIFLAVGLYLLVGVHFHRAEVRKNPFYTLTNKRAFIGTVRGKKRRLKSYPIKHDTAITLDEETFSNGWLPKRSLLTNTAPS